jgi:hypothetical protein
MILKIEYFAFAITTKIGEEHELYGKLER